MECEVEMGNCNLLLKHTKIPEGVGVDPVPCNSDEIQTVKLLDTDSISQAKEKLLDYIYRNRPVSLRPSIGQVELGKKICETKRMYNRGREKGLRVI